MSSFLFIVLTPYEDDDVYQSKDLDNIKDKEVEEKEESDEDTCTTDAEKDGEKSEDDTGLHLFEIVKPVVCI